MAELMCMNEYTALGLDEDIKKISQREGKMRAPREYFKDF